MVPFVSVAKIEGGISFGWAVNYLNKGGKLSFAKYTVFCL
jgi:hypothetical protein